MCQCGTQNVHEYQICCACFQLQLFLSDYLDIRNTASSQTQGPTNFDEPSTDVGAYFTKKKAAKPKKV